MTDGIDASNPYAGGELLARACERKITSGEMEPSALPIILQLYKSKTVVDSVLNVVELEVSGKKLLLDQAVDQILHDTPIFRTREAAPAIKARSDLEASALNGNLTALGKLRREMGAEQFAAWQEKTGARMGKAAVAPGNGMSDAQRRKAAADNPWMDDGEGAVTRRAEFIRRNGPRASVAMATAAGKTLGGKLLPASMRG
jgi:hypothetical protein